MIKFAIKFHGLYSEYLCDRQATCLKDLNFYFNDLYFNVFYKDKIFVKLLTFCRQAISMVLSNVFKAFY